MKIEVKEPVGFQPVTITVQTREEAIAIWHRMNLSSGTFGERCVAVDHRNGESNTPFDAGMDNIVAMEIWRAVDEALGGQND